MVRKLLRIADQQAFLMNGLMRRGRTEGELTLAMPIGEAASAIDGGAMLHRVIVNNACLDKIYHSTSSKVTGSLVVIARFTMYVLRG